MHIKIIFAAGAVLLSTLSMDLFAEETSYSLEYSNSSPIKEVPLNNAELKLEIYKNDKPAGYQNVTTDAARNFKLAEDYDLEVVSIKGQEKFNANCSGSATTDNAKIMISCHKNSMSSTPKNEEIED